MLHQLFTKKLQRVNEKISGFSQVAGIMNDRWPSNSVAIPIYAP